MFYVSHPPHVPCLQALMTSLHTKSEYLASHSDGLVTLTCVNRAVVAARLPEASHHQPGQRWRRHRICLLDRMVLPVAQPPGQGLRLLPLGQNRGGAGVGRLLCWLSGVRGSDLAGGQGRVFVEIQYGISTKHSAASSTPFRFQYCNPFYCISQRHTLAVLGSAGSPDREANK